MIKTAVARRYAKALFGLVESSDIDVTRAGLNQLAQAIGQNPPLQYVLVSPAFSPNEKQEILSALRERLGCPPIMDRFLEQLVKKTRLALLPEIAEKFGALADQQKGIQHVQVTSAKPMNQTEQDNLRRRLRDVLRRDVDIEFHVEPSLLSGLQIRIDGTVFDSTVRNRLTAMRALVTKE
ncbi:MAG: ATP synthase F1 subunit delta [Nitrospiraceae bacterium]